MSYAFEHGQEGLLQALGLPEVILDTARQDLREGVEWTRDAGGVAYTAEAVAKLVRAVNGKNAGFKELRALLEKSRRPEPTTDTPPVPETEAATVTRLFRNPHVIEVQLADGSRVTVRVRSTAALRAGRTVLQVRREADGRYELAQRLPRSVRAGLREKAGDRIQNPE